MQRCGVSIIIACFALATNLHHMKLNESLVTCKRATATSYQYSGGESRSTTQQDELKSKVKCIVYICTLKTYQTFVTVQQH